MEVRSGQVRKIVLEFISVGDERMKILVNSCIRKMDRIGMRRSRKPCAARKGGAIERDHH